MTEQIIYDLYSLIIQICGILIALVAVYAFFRLNKTSELLIGQGLAVYTRQKEIHEKDVKDTPKLKEKHLNRLRHAIFRKNIFGIEESLINITVNEINNGQEKNKKGYFQHVFPIFIKTKQYQKSINKLSYIVIILLISNIILSLSLTVLTNYYYNIQYCLIIYLFILNCIVFITALIFAGYLIHKSINTYVGMEKHKMEECKKLRNNYKEIDKLYHSK